jgi:hypothetical protein
MIKKNMIHNCFATQILRCDEVTYNATGFQQVNHIN